jgi:hypothetical protein
MEASHVEGVEVLCAHIAKEHAGVVGGGVGPGAEVGRVVLNAIL